MKKIKLSIIMILSIIILASCGGGSKNGTNDNSAKVEEKKVKTDDEKIEEIRSKFEAIEKNMSGYTVKEAFYTNPDPEKYYDMSGYKGYYKGNELVKLVESVGEEGYLSEISMYYSNNKVFFIYTERFYMDDLYEQERNYIDESGNVFKALIKTKEDGDTQDISKISNVENPGFVKNKNEFINNIKNLYQSALERYAQGK